MRTGLTVTLLTSVHAVPRGSGGVVDDGYDVVCDGCEESVSEPHSPIVCIERIKARNLATGLVVADFQSRQRLIAWLKRAEFNQITLLPKDELIAAIEAGVPWGDS